MKKVIYYFSQKYLGNWENIYNAIYTKENINEKDLESLKMNNDFICISENNYLNKFKQMYMPPFCLFHKGNFELLNKKIFGFLGQITTNDYDEILFLHKNNYAFCVIENNLNNDVINFFIKNKIDLIILRENSLSQNIINNKNILYLSEYDTNEISSSYNQNINRILYSLSDDIYIKSKNKENIKLIFNNYQNERKNCYLIFETKLSDEIKEMIDKRIIKIIKSVSDIVNYYKS